MHVILSTNAEVTVQTTASILILVSVVNPFPVRVKTVPPLVLPEVGSIDFKNG